MTDTIEGNRTMTNEADGLAAVEIARRMLTHLDECDRTGKFASIGTDHIRQICEALTSTPAARMLAGEVEAVAYASPEQMAAMGDPIGDMAGAYIPLRKTRAGKFTMPLYAHPPAAEPLACDLGPMHGKASTYTDASGVVCCDFCGHPAEPVGLREAVYCFLSDYDDGDRADAGNGVLMEMHIEAFRAALSTHPQPSQKGEGDE